MSAEIKWRPLQVLRGSKGESRRYDGRRDVYLSINISGVSLFLAIKPEHVEFLRESLVDYDANDPDLDEPEPDPVDAAAAKGEWDANVMGPER